MYCTLFLSAWAGATWAKYWMTFFVFSVFPAPDSPLHGREKKTWYVHVTKNESLTWSIWTGSPDLLEINNRKECTHMRIRNSQQFYSCKSYKKSCLKAQDCNVLGITTLHTQMVYRLSSHNGITHCVIPHSSLYLPTLKHVSVGIVSNGKYVRRHFSPPSALVHTHYLLCIDGQTSIRVDSDTKQSRVSL